MQLEVELAVRETAVGIAERHPVAAIPDHHRARAVLGLRNLAFERRIFERMILGPYGEPAVLRIVARLLRHRPALQHAVVLEPEVIVQPRRVVPLDDELQLAAGPAPRAARLGRSTKVALALVRIELRGHKPTETARDAC